MNEYKNIVLLKGLECMEDYQFRIIKSLLRKQLKLTKKMQDDYDRIQLADLMEDKFPKEAGLDKLIKVCELIEDLKDLAQNLKTERAKVQKKKKKKSKMAVKKRKQDELSTSESLSISDESSKNKPSSKKQKNTIIKKHSIKKAEGPPEKHQLVEFSTTSNFPAVSEIPTFEGLSAIASNSLQSSQKPPEAHLDLKMSPGFPASPCQNFPVSPASDSSIHLNSNVPSTLFSGAQVPLVPSATAFSNVGVLCMPLETMFCSSSALQMSPITLPSNTQDLHLLTPAAFNNTEAPHSQAIASRNVQTTKVPLATLTNKAQLIKMPPPATASSSSQVPHTLATLSRSISTTQVPQTTTSSSIQASNSATVKASKKVQAPQVHLPIVPNYMQASQAPPSATPSSLTALPVRVSIATSRAQTTQIHPGTGSICVKTLHTPPPTVSRSVCTTQLTQAAASATGKALPLPKVKASSKVQTRQVPSATASGSLLASDATPTTASGSLLAPQLSSVTTSRALHATPGHTATHHSNPSTTPTGGTVPKEPSKVEGYHQGPKQVMVLKVTEPFPYGMKEDKERMFHATVATETEFFRVKVFDESLKSKFIPRKIIAISDYFGNNGFLEIYRPSCVSDVNIDQPMVISSTLRQRANATPKISHLFSQTVGTFVNGEFEVIKKTERDKFVYYGIEDDTGKMEVVVYGRLTNINCEPGNKLRLVCFELTSTEDTCQLTCARHSYMQVINAEGEEKPLNTDSTMRTSLEPYF